MIIAITADIHISHTNLDDARRCWLWFRDAVQEINADLVIVAGDLFDKSVVGSPAVSTGELYRVAQEGLNTGINTIIIPGNHDYGRPGQAHACQPLEALDNVEVINEPMIRVIDNSVVLCFLPWISKAYFAGNNGDGLDDDGFRARVSTILKEWAVKAKENNRRSILIGHAQVRGSWLNNSTQCDGGDLLLDPEDLRLFDDVCLGDFHRRQEFYVGALFQHNFGEEGNPAGFRIIDTDDPAPERGVNCLASPIHRTVDVHTDDDLPEFRGEFDRVKIRIHPDYPPGVSPRLQSLIDRGAIVTRIAERSEQIRTTETLDDTAQGNPHAVLDHWAGHNSVDEAELNALHAELKNLLEEAGIR